MLSLRLKEKRRNKQKVHTSVHLVRKINFVI